MLRFELPGHIKKVENTEIQTHYCFSCGNQIPVGGMEICPACHWGKCPSCGGCACTLTHEAQMAVRGVYLTFCQYCHNPCPKHHSMTKKEIEYTEKWEKTPDYQKWRKENPEAAKEYDKMKKEHENKK